MIILTSPAKSLDFESDYHSPHIQQPKYLEKAAHLVLDLEKLSVIELKKVLKVSDGLAELNFQRLKDWSKVHDVANSRPALYAYKGDVFQQLDLNTYLPSNLEYAGDSLRIISGLYGIIGPFDLIQPYRLEMGTKFDIDLYDFWTEQLSKDLHKELEQHSPKIVLNLASNEYSKSINSDIVGCPLVNVKFLQKRKGVFKTFGLLAKRARGMMIDFCIKNEISDLNEVKKFKVDGYKFDKSESIDNELVFKQQIIPLD